MAGWDYEQISPPLADTTVDDITNTTGVIDTLPSLSLDITDSEIIKNLDSRINDAQSYWDKPEGFNLREVRNENTRLHLGKQIDVTHLYRFQVPYVENQIFVGEESIVAYVTARSPEPEVYPAQDTERSKSLASDLEKAAIAHSQKFDLRQKLEVAVRNLLNKRIGIIKLRFDPTYGKNGEIIPEVIDPDHLIIDKNAALGANPAFICHVLKYSVEELVSLYPDKKTEVFEKLGIKRGTPKQMSHEVAVREVWLTHYVKGKPQEGCVTYFNGVVLAKYKNPNWLYNSPNFLDVPFKPFIPLNYINYGTHWIDVTTPVEQAANLQNILNKRGRQLMEIADKANGMLVISTDSGLTKDDAQNLTGDPNQKLIIATKGQPINDLVYQVPPPEISPVLMQDKQDTRIQLLNIMGAPTDFTGSQSDDGDPTLGEVMIKKNQAAGRQDLIVRAVDSFMDKYFKFLVQMMLVWYDEKHFFVYNGGDGEFDYITMHRSLIEEGMAINVKAGTTLPFDKSRQQAISLQLLKMKATSLLDAYKDLGMDSPQKRYDNWAKQTSDPMALARDALDDIESSAAYVEFIEFMNGKEPKMANNVDREHILTHRKQMLTDDFLQGKPKNQLAFIKRIGEEVKSLELRTSLDQMSQEGVELLDPKVPIQPSMPPMPQASGMMPPGAMPGQPNVPAGQPGLPPGQLPPSSPGPLLGNVTGGTPVPNMANPTMPPAGSVSSLPMV